jgi:hypothetical protein
VVNYAQFESHAAAAVLRHIAAEGHLKYDTDLATVAPGQYEVIWTLDTPQSNPP